MSADQQRLNSAIQQIAERSPRVRALLEANDNRGGKPGAAGVGVSEAEETRICCDGSTSDNANPGVTELDPDSDGAGQPGGLDPDDPARLDSGPGTLSGVTDCATGEPICVDGAGFIPPDGWDEPNEPPVDPIYEEGKYYEWRIVLEDLSFVYVYGLTRAEADANACAKVSSYSSTYTVCGINCEGDYIAISANSRTATPFCSSRSTIDGYRYTDTVAVTDNLAIRNCATAYRSDMCDIESPPVVDSWPEDGCANLAIINGSIVGSKYDPENDGSYSAPVQELEVCDSTSGNRILLRVDTNSTYKSIKSLSGDIDPDTQAGYLYDTTTGQRIRQISPSEFRDPAV